MKPTNLLIAPKPGELPLGKSARISFHQKHGFRQGHLSSKYPPSVPVTNTLQRFHIEVIASLRKALHLVDQSFFDHSVTTPIDKTIKFRPLAAQTDFEGIKGRFVETVLFLPLAYRLARQFVNLQCPNNTLAVVRVNPECRRRIDLLKPLVKGSQTMLLRF